jgi:hypothetical protein
MGTTGRHSGHSVTQGSEGQTGQSVTVCQNKALRRQAGCTRERRTRTRQQPRSVEERTCGSQHCPTAGSRPVARRRCSVGRWPRNAAQCSSRWPPAPGGHPSSRAACTSSQRSRHARLTTASTAALGQAAERDGRGAVTLAAEAGQDGAAIPAQGKLRSPCQLKALHPVGESYLREMQSCWLNLAAALLAVASAQGPVVPSAPQAVMGAQGRTMFMHFGACALQGGALRVGSQCEVQHAVVCGRVWLLTCLCLCMRTRVRTQARAPSLAASGTVSPHRRPCSSPPSWMGGPPTGGWPPPS